MKALALALFVFSAVAATQASDLRSYIESSNKKVSQAMLKKDIAGLEKLFKSGMTKDFKYVENGKTQTFAEMMQNMKMGLTSMKNVTVAKSKVLSLKEAGNRATATMEHSMGGTVDGPDKKIHTTAFTGTSVETYVKVGSQWKMSKMEWKNQKMMMDGKPMPAGAGS